MSYQPIDIDNHGVPTLTLPPASDITVRPCDGADPAVMQWGPIAAWPDLEWLLRMQSETTRCLVDLGYADECVTPETLARAGGAA